MADALTEIEVKPTEAGVQSRRLPRFYLSTRVRILGWYMVLLAIAVVFGLFLQRSILLAQLNDQVNAELLQEAEELQQLSTGRNPNTGEPFGNDITAIFDTFLSRNIPVEGEVLFTLVDGKPYTTTISQVQLLEDPAVVAEWAAVREPRLAELDSALGRVRYLAVPVIAEDGRQGTFITAIFLEARRDEVDRALRAGGLVYGSVFVLVSVLAWFAAGRVLRPVRWLTETSLSIKDDDWSRRIPVQGDDEIARLGRTFNEMLDRLEESFVTQRRFLDDAGHELRTPITIVRGHLELMGDDPAERAEVKRLVLDELGRMSRMVEDLLLLARADHPGFLDLHPIDVAELTQDVVTKATALSDRHQWRLQESAPIVLDADRQRLTQALVNLARNAVEYSEAGTSINIGSRVIGGEVELWVQDEGAGVAPADRERIFERFSRGQGGRRNSEGAGLGLAIVKAIAEAHGGRVSLQSVLGIGSRFAIVIPLDESEEDS